MTFDEIKNKTSHVQGLFALESFFPRIYRKRAKEFLILLLPLIVLVLMFFVDQAYVPKGVLYGALCLISAAWIIIFALDAFFYEYFFRGIKPMLHEWGLKKNLDDISFEVLSIVARGREADATGGFAELPVGRLILLRLGVSAKEILSFLDGNRKQIWSTTLRFGDPVTLLSYAETIYNADPAFAGFLFGLGIKKEDFLAAVGWVMRDFAYKKNRLRWWGKDGLGRIKGIGKEWSYGETYNLEKFGSFVTAQEENNLFAKETTELERTLLRSREANALLIGDELESLMSVVQNLSAQIQIGTIMPQLEHKKVFVLNESLISAHAPAQSDFENLTQKLLKEAARAGDIILVFQNFPGFVQTAMSRSVDIVNLLEPYLQGAAIQFVALSTKDAYANILEKLVELTARFERIFVLGDDKLLIFEELEKKVATIEHQTKLFFTYQAVEAIAQDAKRYFAGDVLFDKTLDLLDEIVPNLLRKGIRVVTKKHVDELVTSKTGVPIGEATTEEKNKLLGLEKILHERVIGQDAAVSAIASALRRSRSGITDSKRPIGSFLFLGPTGVGKTETAKTLARAFFGSEDNMIRFDMSEYNTFDALIRLIGSHETDKPGVLAEVLREKQYGVLLLDEFEKATEEVHNLFLQIIDEGFFSDARGKRVNARNLIIIATSNAGSDYIWQIAKEGGNPADEKTKIIDSLIKNKTFKPELINRFDEVIIFHPLGSEHRDEVAKILLGELHERLISQGIDLNVTPELISFISEKASDRAFGARPLRRFIQEKVEETIAKMLLEGKIKMGSKVTLEPKELSIE